MSTKVLETESYFECTRLVCHNFIQQRVCTVPKTTDEMLQSRTTIRTLLTQNKKVLDGNNYCEMIRCFQKVKNDNSHGRNTYFDIICWFQKLKLIINGIIIDMTYCFRKVRIVMNGDILFQQNNTKSCEISL